MKPLSVTDVGEKLSAQAKKAQTEVLCLREMMVVFFSARCPSDEVPLHRIRQMNVEELFKLAEYVAMVRS